MDDFVLDTPVETENNVDVADDAFIDGFTGDLPKHVEPVEKEAQPVLENMEDPRISFVDQLAKQFDMQPEEYIQQVKESQQQEELYSLMDRGLTEEEALELLETRQFKAFVQEQQEKEFQQKEQQESAMFQDFLTYFEQQHGRPWSEQDEIPKQAWEAVGKGVSLKDAYQEHSFEMKFLEGFNSI